MLDKKNKESLKKEEALRGQRSSEASAGLRTIGAVLTSPARLIGSGMESAGERGDRITGEQGELAKGRTARHQENVDAMRPVIIQMMRNAAAAGKDWNDVMDVIEKENKGLYKSILNTGQNEFKDAMGPLSDAAKKFREFIDAMNLGMRDVVGSAKASSVSLQNFVSSIQVGSSPLEQSLNTLSAAMTSAGAHISSTEFDAAIGEAEKTLKGFGSTDAEVDKFTRSMKGSHRLQQKFAKIFNEDFKKSLEAKQLGGGQPADMRKMLGDLMSKELSKEYGEDSDIVKQFQTLFGALDPEDIDVTAILAGKFDSLDKLQEKLGKPAVDKLTEIYAPRMHNEKLLNGLLKEKIQLERTSISVQKQALNIQMEAREIASKHGGATFGIEQKRELILQRANVGAGGMGIDALKGGGIGELRRRNAQIGAGFSDIEQRGRVPGGMQRGEGVKLDAKAQDLMKANADHANLIRNLIKLEQEELQILEKKNALEKASMESLIKGDLKGFLDQQAAVGATAAIATGDTGLQGLFGASALGGAFENIKTQKEAGVQSLYGQKLGGAGGLLEQSAQAAAGARGIRDLGSAQIMAGTTPEELRRQENIQGMAGVLAETGEIAADMVAMQAKTAVIHVTQAHIVSKEDRFQRLSNRGPDGTLNGERRSRGGLIYADRGVFVPKGTDTVPAMLTPGEFVVRRQAVQRGNNLQMLRAMNGGDGARFQSGGPVGYYHNGGTVEGNSVGLDAATVSKLAASLSVFNSELSKNIDNLNNTQFQIKLDTTNVNVNLNGTSFLAKLKDDLKTELIAEVGQQIQKVDFNMAGEPTFNTNVLQGMS